MSDPSLLELLRSDTALKKHWFLKNESWFVRNVRVYLEPGTIAVFVYRFGHWVHRLNVPVLKQLLFILYAVAKFPVVVLFGIYVPAQLRVGRGFCIHNFSGIFLPRTVAGDNLIVFQNVTVGHLRGAGGRPPRLGNNVFLGAGAKVLGDIDVGNDVVVGANSVVMNDIPDNCSVMGVPARIVSRDTSWIQEKLNGEGNHW